MLSQRLLLFVAISALLALGITGADSESDSGSDEFSSALGSPAVPQSESFAQSTLPASTDDHAEHASPSSLDRADIPRTSTSVVNSPPRADLHPFSTASFLPVPTNAWQFRSIHPSDVLGTNLYPWPAGRSPFVARTPTGSLILGAYSGPHRWQIDRFSLSDGRRFGPLKLFQPWFQVTPYPLDLPLFQQLYLSSPSSTWTPVSFELFLNEDRQFVVRQTHFRPEPNILDSIHKTLSAPLLFEEIMPRRIVQGRAAKEGQWLWPPVVVRSDELQALGMAEEIKEKMASAFWARMAAHNRAAPQVFHLKVATREGERSVLMTPVQATKFTDLLWEPEASQFWLFHEGMVSRGGEGRPTMAFLGGMF